MTPALVSILVAAAAPAEASRLLQRLDGVTSAAARVDRASELLLGRPYELHPLGEGEGAQDPKPRFRLDAFDCQTFVETALALAFSRNEGEARAALDDLRYHGPPSFATRNHFMMSQWVPSNIVKGYLGVPLPGPDQAEKLVTEESWKTRSTREIQLPEDQIPLGHYSLPVVPLDRLLEAGPHIESGTLMLIVRADRPRFPDRVTHLGFVIQRPGEHGVQTFFRHASDTFHRVVDEPLDHFVTRNQRYAYKVEGVTLLPILDRGH